jgi:hypothetical protein
VVSFYCFLSFAVCLRNLKKCINTILAPGRRQRGREDASDLCASLQTEELVVAAAEHARANRLGHRPVPDLQGGKHDCQIVSFQIVNPNSGILWRTLESTMSAHFEYFTTIVYILWSFGNFIVICYNFPPLCYIEPRKIWQPWR